MSDKKSFTRKYALLASLYCTQFMGIGFIYAAVPAILRKEGVPLDQISYVYAIGLFWAVKFLWAPIIDRYSLGGEGRFGHYRSWILLLQAAMVASLLAAAFFEMPAQYSILLWVFAVLSFFSSTQDIATDAMAFNLLKTSERGMGNAVQTAGAMLGNIIGAGLILIAYNTIGWSGSLILLAVMTSLSFVHVYFSQNIPGTNVQKAAGQVGFSSIWRFFNSKRNLSWLVVILFFYSGLSISYALMNPMLVDFNWSLEKIGWVSSVFGSFFGIVGALFIGGIVKLFGRKVAMFVAGIATLLSVAGLLVPLHFPVNDLILFISVMLIFIGYGAGSTIVYTVMMDNSRPESAGTDFTLQFSVAFIFGFVASGIALSQAETHGYTSVLYASAVISAIALGLILLYRGFHDGSSLAVSENTGSDVETATVSNREVSQGAKVLGDSA